MKGPHPDGGRRPLERKSDHHRFAAECGRSRRRSRRRGRRKRRASERGTPNVFTPLLRPDECVGGRRSARSYKKERR